MRSWPGLAAIGAGLIHLGVAAGSPPLQLVAFSIPGAAELLWGALALARPEASRPRVALGAAAALVALQLVALLAHTHGGGGAALPLGAIAGAAVLDLAVAALSAVRLRRGSDGTGTAGPVGFLLGTAAGAAVVAALTVTSLAGTAVGAHHVH